ncbi:hypothetical protein D3C86_2028500 [compost metagenome]
MRIATSVPVAIRSSAWSVWRNATDKPGCCAVKAGSAGHSNARANAAGDSMHNCPLISPFF